MPASLETRYATTADGVSIAYQVLGRGPHDLVFIPGWISHLDLDAESPVMRPFFDRVAEFCRVIRLDKRGTGLSDRGAGAMSLEARMDDVRAVMDACESTRAMLLGLSEGGPMSILFAATYPERVEGLILCDTTAYADRDMLGELLTIVEEAWGRGMLARYFARDDEDFDELREMVGIYERASASPGAARTIIENLAQFDVRSVLPLVNVPTLVMHVEGDRLVHVAQGRELAQAIPGARYVELRGDSHVPWYLDMQTALAEIQEFVTGVRPPPTYDRVLATVLFTDIVDSTVTAATVGDRQWRGLLDVHDRLSAREVAGHGGRVVKTTGDGLLATFDGPARAVRCAGSLVHELAHHGLTMRAGLHAGEVELRGDDVGGIAVHVAARIEGAASDGEVLTSHTVKDLVAGSGIVFEDRGLHALKGLPEEWRLFAATSS